MTDNFDGKDFSENPIEGKDASRIRHLLHEMEDVWPKIRDATTLVASISILYRIGKIGAGLGTVGAIVGAYLNFKGTV